MSAFAAGGLEVISELRIEKTNPNVAISLQVQIVPFYFCPSRYLFSHTVSFHACIHCSVEIVCRPLTCQLVQPQRWKSAVTVATVYVTATFSKRSTKRMPVKYNYNKPILGISRGCQFLTVAHGGSLEKNGRHHINHSVNYKGSNVEVCSRHEEILKTISKRRIIIFIVLGNIFTQLDRRNFCYCITFICFFNISIKKLFFFNWLFLIWWINARTTNI